MAYAEAGLQPIGGQSKAGNAPQIWSYTSTDAKTDIDASGYFNSASDLLKVGDLIYVHASTGGTRTYSLHPVVSNASGVVDVGDGTAVSATDSD
jgi:hypothetical protein|tara:strand:+ start:2074 stop:2355 length:282 start_codon:yes stop_codon:yes gene_type:complete